MSSVQDKAMELALESVQLAGAYKALKAENEHLRERVKDLERQLADGYARIAEMAKWPTIPADSVWTPLGTTITTCGPTDCGTTCADPTPTTSTAK